MGQVDREGGRPDGQVHPDQAEPALPAGLLLGEDLGQRQRSCPSTSGKGRIPLTFKYYDPAKGWPVCTGAYKLTSVSETEFTYVRDDNWWGAKTGFKKLPEPKKLIWTWAGPEETRAALMADGKLDSLMDVTLGALQALQAKNPNVIAWFDKDAVRLGA